MTSEKQLRDLANLMRRDVLKMTTESGSGHPTSCLSCAEIFSVLFFDEMKYDIKNPLNCDNDEFILSKGHAAPILYSALNRAGCIKENLNNLRKLNSNLEGHPMPKSLNWVKVSTGSLGQGLSVGVGMALAGKLQKRKFRTFVLLGDSEMSEGSNYEALQLGNYYQLDNLFAIVDVNRLGQRGETILGHKMNEWKKQIEGFGWNVIIVDGHNISELKKAFFKSFKLSKINKSKKPTLLLCKTFKGKGVSFLENFDGWHGKSIPKEKLEDALSEIPNPKEFSVKIKKPFRLKNEIGKKVGKKVGKEINFSNFHDTNNHNNHDCFNNLNSYKIGEFVSTRESYGYALSDIAKSKSDIVVVDGEVSNSTNSEEIKKVNKNNFIEGFVAEQNAVGMALGLEKKGYNVFVSSFSAFLSRAHDQIRMSALSSPNKLTFCGSHSGVSIGEDGASQMGLEDISIFRTLPDSIVFYPSDAISTDKLTKLAYRTKGIKYIRTTRPKTKVIYDNSENFKLGDFKIIKQSHNDKAIIVGAGITLHESIKAYEELKNKGISVGIIDLYCIKPFDEKKFLEFVKKHGKNVIVVEDHYKEGGIGEMISSVIASSQEKLKINFKHLYIDKIPHSGKSDELLRKYGIDQKAIVESVLNF